MDKGGQQETQMTIFYLRETFFNYPTRINWMDFFLVFG